MLRCPDPLIVEYILLQPALFLKYTCYTSSLDNDNSRPMPLVKQQKFVLWNTAMSFSPLVATVHTLSVWGVPSQARSSRALLPSFQRDSLTHHKVRQLTSLLLLVKQNYFLYFDTEKINWLWVKIICRLLYSKKIRTSCLVQKVN